MLLICVTKFLKLFYKPLTNTLIKSKPQESRAQYSSSKHSSCFFIVPAVCGTLPLERPVPRKAISNGGVNRANRGLNFIFRSVSVPERTTNSDQGDN